MDDAGTGMGNNSVTTLDYFWRQIYTTNPEMMMSFQRHNSESIDIKKEADKSTSIHANGLCYSLFSCSPALLNSALPNTSNVKK